MDKKDIPEVVAWISTSVAVAVCISITKEPALIIGILLPFFYSQSKNS